MKTPEQLKGSIRRMAANDNTENLSHEDVMKELGIIDADLADVDVEIE